MSFKIHEQTGGRKYKKIADRFLVLKRNKLKISKSGKMTQLGICQRCLPL